MTTITQTAELSQKYENEGKQQVIRLRGARCPDTFPRSHPSPPLALVLSECCAKRVSRRSLFPPRLFDLKRSISTDSVESRGADVGDATDRSQAKKRRAVAAPARGTPAKGRTATSTSQNSSSTESSSENAMSDVQGGSDEEDSEDDDSDAVSSDEDGDDSDSEEESDDEEEDSTDEESEEDERRNENRQSLLRYAAIRQQHAPRPEPAQDSDSDSDDEESEVDAADRLKPATARMTFLESDTSESSDSD